MNEKKCDCQSFCFCVFQSKCYSGLPFSSSVITLYLEYHIIINPMIIKGIESTCPVFKIPIDIFSTPCGSFKNSTKNRIDHSNTKNKPNNQPCWYFLVVYRYKIHNKIKRRKYPPASKSWVG